MIRALLLPLFIELVLTGSAHAEKWAVKTIKYENNGAYQSFFTIQSMYTHRPLECLGRNTQNDGLQSGQSVKIELDNSNGSLLSPPDGKCTPKIGREVWGVVYIDRGRGFYQTGPKQGCRKDGSKFYYHPEGGTLVVQTKGTTEHNNRCRIKSRGGVRFPID
ncbi:MAG: hypothetical protein HRT80_07780 [Henriciella sp.]|nr:hypothetical protein [Henriciella sp.]